MSLKNHKNQESSVLSIDEFCRAFGISNATLFRLWASGKGPKSIKIGRRRLIPKADLEEWFTRLYEYEESYGNQDSESEKDNGL